MLFDALLALAVAAAWFLVELVSDVLSCAWHNARESRRAVRAANLGLASYFMTYAPVIVAGAIAYATGNVLAAAAGFIGGGAGAWLGSYLGVKLCGARG